jgi:hypothetical protein
MTSAPTCGDDCNCLFESSVSWWSYIQLYKLVSFVSWGSMREVGSRSHGGGLARCSHGMRGGRGRGSGAYPHWVMTSVAYFYVLGS